MRLQRLNLLQSQMPNFTPKNPLLWDEVLGGAERMTQTYRLNRQGMSEHTTTQFAHKMDF